MLTWKGRFRQKLSEVDSKIDGYIAETDKTVVMIRDAKTYADDTVNSIDLEFGRAKSEKDMFLVQKGIFKSNLNYYIQNIGASARYINSDFRTPISDRINSIFPLKT